MAVSADTHAAVAARRRAVPVLAAAAGICALGGGVAGAQVGAGGGTSAPTDPRISSVQCLTKCIGPTTGVVGSRIRVLGSDLGATRVVSLPRANGRRAKDKKPKVKPSGAVIARVVKRATSGRVRVSDSWGQRRESPGSFTVGTKAQLRQAQKRWRFPVRGKHNYGGSAARFGAARGGRSHQGHDVFAACGTRLVAARGGKVKARGFQGSAGNYVVIDGAGVKQDHVYMHLKRRPKVAKGQQVTAGQFIGRVGQTGNASGCHLHFEIWVGKGWYSGGKPINPLRWLKYWDSFS